MPSTMDTPAYLRTLEAVRERCDKVLERGTQGQLGCFDVHVERLGEAADMITRLIERDYGPVDEQSIARTLAKIPPHGRWRHFGHDNIAGLISKLEDQLDRRLVTKTVLDLFVVAVLLDAGAGDAWQYRDAAATTVYTRSEGLAVAALRMFQAGVFSSNPQNLLQADSVALKSLTEDDLIRGFQVTADNPLLGVNGRTTLLRRLGSVLEEQTAFFPRDADGYARPGALLDYLLPPTSSAKDATVSIDALWTVVMEGFSGVWPESRTKLDGVALGDVWPCTALGCHVPFHKLSQWLTYSLMEPIEALLRVRFAGVEKMTGLAEYRNGGFFVDVGVITPRAQALAAGGDDIAHDKSSTVPSFAPDSQMIVEWRALTVALIDRLAAVLRERLGADADALPLAKILEAGTWKAGREVAKSLRPSAGPPIAIISDGTLF